MEQICPKCHTVVRPTDYFCFNCGANLKPPPPSMSIESQVLLYLGSFFLPPFGVYWGWKYLRNSDMKVRTVGYIACGLTALSLIIAMIWTMNIFNTVSNQVNQLQNIPGF